jgi:hypothetical protein
MRNTGKPRPRPRTTRKPRLRLVVCVRNDDYPAALEQRKIYCALPDRDAGAHGLIRVIDESGADYLFSAGYFVPVSLPPRVRRALQIQAGRAGC